MSGGTKPLYLTEETMKIADEMNNFSQWVQKKLTQHKIKHGGPETEVHHIKEAGRWDNLINECLRYVNQAADIAHEHSIPRQPTQAVVENWARGYQHEIHILDLTEEQFVEKVMKRVKE